MCNCWKPAQFSCPASASFYNYVLLYVRVFNISTGYCTVALKSWQYSSPNPDGYIAVNGKKYLDVRWSDHICEHMNGTHRGINIMEFDMETCSASNWKWFDTDGYPPKYFPTCPSCTGETPILIDYLSHNVSIGTVLLGISIDDSMRTLEPAWPVLLAAGIDVKDLYYRAMFAFVMQEGFKNKTVLKKSQPTFKPIELFVTITETREWKIMAR